MLKFKKIAIALLSCCILGTNFSSMTVLAAENTTPIVSDDTIITDNNLNDVLDYVGVNKNDFIRDSSISNGVTTVKELKSAIMQAKHTSTPRSTSQKLLNNDFRASGTKSMTQTFDVDAYTIDLTVSANYSGKSWTSVNGVSASVDSAQLVITYKIDSQDLSATCSSSKITASGTVYVQAYVGVGDLGLIKVGDPQSNQLRANYYASNYL